MKSAEKELLQMQATEKSRTDSKLAQAPAAERVILPAREWNPLPAFGCSFWKGRVALYAILKALGVGTGDRVLTPGYTCFVVPSAIRFTGAEPVYADIDPRTYAISVKTLESASDARVKAVIVQHTYGIPADEVAIVRWARSNGIAVIEDCAHVFGSRYRAADGSWRPVGAAGDAAFFSSQWTKPVSTGLGGWVISSDPQLETGVQRFHEEECISPSFWETSLLALQVLVREIFSSSGAYWFAKSAYQKLYRHGLLVGTSTCEELRGEKNPLYAKRMSRFQHWLLRRRLADTAVIEHRRQLQHFYDEALTSEGLPSVHVPEYADVILLRYPVRIPNKKRAIAEARRCRIELGDWYRQPVDPPGDSCDDSFGYVTGTCPEGERAAREVINLPMHMGIHEREAEKIVKFVKEVA